jgi:hypothetical protein
MLYGHVWSPTRVARTHLHTELIVKSGRRTVWVETKKPKVKPGLPLGGSCCISLPPLSFVAGDTMITLADGSSEPIDRLTNANWVATGSRFIGSAPVTLTAVGYPGGEIMVIRTAAGRHLAAAPQALIVTPDGPEKTSDLAPGDNLVTQNGQDQVASISVEPFDGEQAAIAVDTGQDLPTMLANGIAVVTR